MIEFNTPEEAIAYTRGLHDGRLARTGIMSPFEMATLRLQALHIAYVAVSPADKYCRPVSMNMAEDLIKFALKSDEPA